MRPEQKSQSLLGVTRSKAKMLEYEVPEDEQIRIYQDPAKLFAVTVGLLGDLAAAINSGVHNIDELSEMKSNLLFSAQFFDSYIQAELNSSLDPYLLLLGSASYYLCDLPGSSTVLAKRIERKQLSLEGEGLEDLLICLLQNTPEKGIEHHGALYSEFIKDISTELSSFFKRGSNKERIINLSQELRKSAYEFGTPRQLLLGDVISAILRVKIYNSTWESIPLYSGLSKEKWASVLQKNSSIKELWPAQHLIGQAGVLKGESSIIQMPTSAGKTKATELILRSAFLAERASLAIIIAPFRALCHEIKNDLAETFRGESIEVNVLSDVLQVDFEINEFLAIQQILVVTPEKLLYILRHNPELASSIGLLILDEGHQFDNGTRGATYELLLTSLRFLIPRNIQKVLISAVISNASSVGKWLNGTPNVVSGSTLIPTYKSLGFVSWLDRLGRIEYVDYANIDKEEFFVPRVIRRINLGTKGAERKDRHFPEEKSGKDIALYLGLTLAPKGGVAIFCGKKSTANSICERAV